MYVRYIIPQYLYKPFVATCLSDGPCIAPHSCYNGNLILTFWFPLSNFTWNSWVKVLRVVIESFFLTREADFTGVPTHLNGDRWTLCYKHYVLPKTFKSGAWIQKNKLWKLSRKMLQTSVFLKQGFLIREKIKLLESPWKQSKAKSRKTTRIIFYTNRLFYYNFLYMSML